MSDRLATELRVGALLRRVNDAGGIAMVLAKGDRHDGAILILTYEKSRFSGILEPVAPIDGAARLERVGPDLSCDSTQVADYWQRRRHADPDLWVIELDIASAEWFAAETVLVS